MERTRWAMVGTGLMLQLIGGDFPLAENVDLRVIVSRDRQRAEEAAARHGIVEASADFDAVLARSDIDVVYIATPHSEHVSQAMAALRAGKHVLVEKPMSPTAAQTAELCAFARSCGLFAMEAMWTAFNPAVVELRRRIADGVIGEVRSVSANFCINVPYQADHRLWRTELAGGSTLDQGVYPLSLAYMILGEPETISATGTLEHGVDAEVVAKLSYATGQWALCVNGLRSCSPLDAYVSGTAGAITLDGPFWATGGFVQHLAGPGGWARTDRYTYDREGAGYVPMLRAVSAAVLEGRTEHSLRSHADTVSVARTMDEVLRQVHRPAR